MTFFDSLRKQKFLSFALVLFTLAIGILIGTVMSTGVKAAKDQVAAPGATPLTIPNPVQLQNSFSTIAKTVEPSVVNISTEYVEKPATSSRRNPQQQRRRAPSQGDEGNGDDDNNMQDFFQRFFGGPSGPMLEAPQGPMKQSSLGSGVVVDKNGYILTNNHVVEKATRIKVKFTNEETEYDAHVIGTDPLTDLAVVKVEKGNLTAAPIGNSDAIQVGDWAVAIGSPFGFNETVTAGIISAKERDIPGDTTSFQHFLQTDAAINPGNSGGPLLNIRGEVIGINTMIASRTGGNQGIGFAMPINTAVKVYNQIIKTGHVTRGSIGIRFPAENNADLLKAYGAKLGVFVEGIQPGGPAEKAGVKPEDIVTTVNGKSIKKGQDLIDEVAETPVGNSVALSVLRDGKPMTLNVTVGDRAKVFPEELGKNIEPKDDGGTNTNAKFGIGIQAMTPGLKQNLNFSGTGGVLVNSVENGSFAEDIGLRKNDVILAINRQSVNSIEDVQRIQKTLKNGDSVAFRIMRSTGKGADWQPLFLAGELGSTQ
jgi:serine protease Do